MTLDPRRKLAATALLFAIAIALVAAAAALGESAPLFVAWVPLVLVGWVLARPEPGEVAEGTPAADETAVAPDPDSDAGAHGSSGPERPVPSDVSPEAPADGAREGDAHPG